VDVYIDILRRVRSQVSVALGRDSALWRLSNTCPACQYTLKEEPELAVKMLFTMDGNDSAKWFHKRERNMDAESGENPWGASKERRDPREGGGDYFLSREIVDTFDIHLPNDPTSTSSPSSQPTPNASSIAFPTASEPAASIPGPVAVAAPTPGAAPLVLPSTLALDVQDIVPCEDRWHNMSETKTKAMWGIYDETGMFVSLCRHSFVLLIVDMIKSGELYVFLVSFECPVF
jgi:hypothetical protein